MTREEMCSLAIHNHGAEGSASGNTCLKVTYRTDTHICQDIVMQRLIHFSIRANRLPKNQTLRSIERRPSLIFNGGFPTEPGDFQSNKDRSSRLELRGSSCELSKHRPPHEDTHVPGLQNSKLLTPSNRHIPNSVQYVDGSAKGHLHRNMFSAEW